MTIHDRERISRHSTTQTPRSSAARRNTARRVLYYLTMIRSSRFRTWAWVRPLAVLTTLSVFGCVSGQDEESALFRGDQAAARGELDEALAEYRLAARQSSEDPSTLSRVAHTYAQMGRVEEARDYYREAVLHDPAMADQAASDLLFLAREAAAREDLFGVASALEAAMEFRPGVSVSELALPLARHYFANGEQGRSLPYYQTAMAAMTDSIPAVIYEAAGAYEEVGDCRRALLHYEQYRGMLRRWQRGEVDWKIGNCSFRLAQELRATGDTEDALIHVERTLELGEPRNIQAQAHFERGEILSGLGRCEEAMEAFLAVRGASQTATNPLVERAQWRYDELRFVSPSDEFLSLGGC